MPDVDPRDFKTCTVICKTQKYEILSLRVFVCVCVRERARQGLLLI